MRRLCLLIGLLLASVVPASAQVSLDASEIYLGSTPCRILSGSGSPESSVTAPVCSVYLRTDSTGGIYEKTSGSGNTGWALIGLPSAGSAGTFLRSTGSSWGASTLVLPNAATANRIPYATSANTWGESSNLTFDGSALSVTGSIAASTNVTFGGHLVPSVTDASDIGTADKLIRSAWISTINALVFAETTQTIFGGYSTIGHNAGSLAADVSAAATTVDFGKTMAPGDFILIRAHDASGTIKAEYMLVGSNTTGTTYNVTRDLASSHGTDPTWPAGVPFLVRGTLGDGRIDLIAVDGKPRIVIARQGSTYNAQTTDCVLGNLNTYFGYATDIHGLACGSESGTNITMDATNGFRIRNGANTPVSIDATGAASFAGAIEASSGAIGGWDIGRTGLEGTNVGLHSDAVAESARAFDGVTSVAYTTMSEAVVDNWTIGAWVRADATTASTRIVAAWGREGANGYALLQGATGHWGATLLGVANVGTGVSAVTVGDWVFLALKRTSGSSQFYVNGVAVGSAVASAPNPPNSNAYRSVGAMRNSANTGFTTHFHGAVAWAFFTNHAVSDVNLLAMYAGGPGSIGISPDQFDPGSIFNTYPLIGDAVEDNTDGAGPLTLVDATVDPDGPPVAMDWARFDVGSGSNTCGVGRPSSSGDIGIWCGASHAARASAPLRVTAAGVLTATGATLSGSVTATSGAIGGWTLGSTSLTAGSGSTTVGLDSGGTNPALYAGSATPGSAPFRVTSAGALTATGATISGAITATSGSVTGALTVGTSGYIASGASAYGTGTGWIAEYNGGTPRFRIGNPSGSQMRWTGTGLEIFGEGWELSDDAGLAFETAGSDGDLERAVSWAGNSRIFERSGIGALSLIGTGNARINIYSADVCMFADSSSSVCVDADSFSVFNGPLSLGTSGNRWSAVYGDSLYSGDLDGLGTVPVCADNSGKLVACP